MGSWKLKVGSWKLYAVLALFALALLLRVLNLNAFITWDEPMWTYRSIRFLMALRRMDFGGTFLVGHPGVMTMWAGAMGIAVQRLLGYGSAADFTWLSSLPTLDPRDVEAMRKLAPFLPAAKLPLVMLHAACIAGIYLLARRLFETKAALLAALLLAMDPFHLALSRILHIDALTANFMLLSVLSLLVHLRHYQFSIQKIGNRKSQIGNPPPIAGHFFLVLSGAFAGLAILSKSYALFLAPFAGLLLAATYLAKERDFRQTIPSLLGSFATWCLAVALLVFLLWPAMWVDPLGTVQGVLDTAFGYAATPHATSKFFLGKTVAGPGPLFYPVVMAFRTTPLVWLGLLAAILYEFTNLRICESGRLEVIALLAYACLFAAFMTLGAKKFDRYMLPVIVALDIVAAWGLAELGKKLKAQNLKLKFSTSNSKLKIWTLDFGFWILLFLLQAGHVISYHPHYLAYYNPLLGGTARAVRALPVGWGEGMDLAARYLNLKKDAENLRVATRGIPGFAPLFKGQTEGLTEHNLAIADYVILYISDVQQNSPGTAALYGQQQPEHVVNIHGVDYAWIYRNTHYQELIAYLESQAQPDDIVLLDAPSPFVKHYQGPLPYYVIADSQGWTEMVERLAGSAGSQRLWYVAYPESGMGDWISYQLNTRALLLDQESLSHATVSHYLLTSPLTLETSPIKVQSDVNFGNRLRLTGYGFTGNTIEYRKQLGITLRWQAIVEMQEGYALSLRLVDEEGHLWGQTDEWLENETSLTTFAWKVGEVSERHHTLSLLPGTPPGRYQVKLILYRVDTLETVDILDERGAPAGTEYTLGTVFVTSPSVPPTIEELAIPHRLHHNFDGRVELLGYDLSSTEVRAGEAVKVVLFWRALRSMESDYRLHLQLRDSEGNVWAEGEFPLANEEYPTNRWKEGEVIRGQYDLMIDAAAPTGKQTLNFKLLTSNLQPLARLSVVAPERLFTVPGEIQYPLQANLADKVAFLGYDLDKTTVQPGGTLHLTLYWQALARMETSYTVFVHLLDAQNRIWGQRDNIPVRGTYPTTIWLPGEVVIDEYEIVVDATAPAGKYQLEVGMYDLATMQRLTAFDEQANPLPGDRILLGKVRVE
jgi:4-amino-4-deoxy-L-arabinose transferase-like glycosyltransferase